MVKDPKSLLVVLFGAIGDVVRAFPLVTQISDNYPNLKITWAVETPSLEIVKCHPRVSRIVEYKRKDGLIGYFRFLKELRSESYEVCIDLQRHSKSGLTSLLSGSPIRIGFNKKNSREANYLFQTDQIEPVEHFSDKVEQYIKFCEKLGFSPSERRDHLLESTSEECAALESKLAIIASEQSIDLVPKDKRVLFLIGSTWKSRLWEMEYYGTLANLLHEEYGFQSFIVGSPKDDVLANSILSASNVPVVSLVGKTTLREFKTLCSITSFGVGSDSGPLHIASGVGLPVISLWGPTSPTRSRPFNNFQNALQSPVGCAGCYHRICPGLDKLCMKSIRPEVVMMKVFELLKGLPSAV